mgnify:CR=1 FL=1
MDVLVGHPEHELLFVATQVARASGLKDPSYAVCNFAKGATERAVQVRQLGDSWEKPKTLTQSLKGNSWLFKETAVYDMLLRGHCPASEPFRRWVTEEVLPTIRKTGKYNAEESSNPIAQEVMDELKSLRALVEASVARYYVNSNRLAGS